MIAGPAPAFSALAWLVVGLTIATSAALEMLPLWILPIMAVIGGWRLLQARRGTRPKLRLVRHLVVVGVIGLLALDHRIGLGVEHAAPLFIWLVWCKLLELDAERDLVATSSLGLFLCGVVMLTQVDLLHTAAAMTAALVLVAGLCWYHAPHLGGARTVDRNRLQQRTRFERQAVWRTLGMTLALGLQALPVALVLFFLIPRPESAPRGRAANEAQTGVGDQLDPGRFAANREDHTVAFRVDFQDSIPPLNDLYWRGLVLWRTDGDRWKRTLGNNDFFTQRRRNREVSNLISGGGEPVRGEVTIPASGQPWIYVPECTTSIATGPSRGGIDAGVDLLPGLVQETGVLLAQSTYRFTADLAARPADAGPLMLGAAVSFQQLDRPQDDATPPEDEKNWEDSSVPRLYQLSQEIFAGIAPRDRSARIDRLERWFVEQKFVYTLTPGVMGDTPMATFLLERKKGYCSHYASAAAILLRLARVPARVVVGFRGGEVNPQGGFLVVRNSHAHAWAEAWDGRVWRRIDLTDLVPAEDPVTGRAGPRTATEAVGPEAMEAARAQDPWYQQGAFALRSMHDYLEARWARSVLSFDRGVQQRLMSWFGFDEAGIWAFAAAAATGLGLALLLTWFLFAWLPSRIRLWRRPAHLRAYSDFQRSLAQAGVPRTPSEGPLDHGQRAARLLPHAAPAIQTATAAWIRLRYAPEADPQDLAHLRAAPAHIRKAYRESQRIRRPTQAKPR